jgi:ABC-type transport system involved in multi-copper enzyme maturation permease subunit
VSHAAVMPAPARPDAFDRLAEAVADRVNPIVVKELRQGLRTRAFWIYFSVLLVANLCISLVAFASTREGAGDVGKVAFMAYFVVLALVQFFVLPYSAYRSMAREAEEETWVLLTLTGLGPRRVLAGKVASVLLQGLLYASASAPFLLFSYYLNGVALPTILVALVFSVAYQLFLVSLAVSLATMAETRIVRSLLHFVVLGMLLQGLGFGIAGAAGGAEFAQRLFDKGSFLLGSVSVLFGMVSTGMLFFELAAARLSLETEDYARAPRVWFVAQALGMLALFLWGFVASGDHEVLMVGAVLHAVHALVVGQLVGADRDGMAPLHWAASGRLSLLKPGALRGFVVATLTLLLGAVGYLAFGVGVLKTADLGVIAAAPAFALLYLAAPHVIARWLPHPPSQTALMVRVVTLGLVVLGVGLPPLIGELGGQPDDLLLNLLNPTLGLVNISLSWDSAGQVIVPWCAALGAAAWAFAVLRRRDVGPGA